MFPYKSEKTIIRSKQDQYALDCLNRLTTRETVNGVSKYATPLLRSKHAPLFNAPKVAVISSLRWTERQLTQNPEQTLIYKVEIQKLVDSGYVRKLSHEEAFQSSESWFVPHHLVKHNGKNRLVFNCSYMYKGESLNAPLLPGPTLGSSLLGVLLHFRERPVAISGDIKSMFHQVCLLPSDKPLLRFLWRSMRRDKPADVL